MWALIACERMVLSDRVIEAWNEASRDLDVRVVAPFSLEVGGRSVSCLAFLPDFGSANGMVVGGCVPPGFEVDSLMASRAQEAGMYYAFINLECYSTYQREAFVEELTDWGYYGASERRPAWLPPASAEPGDG